MATVHKSTNACKVHANHVYHPRIARPAIKDTERAAAGPKRPSIDSFATPPLVESVDELEAEVETGVAMGVVGSYVTPLAVAATSKTDPPPYS